MKTHVKLIYEGILKENIHPKHLMVFTGGGHTPEHAWDITADRKIWDPNARDFYREHSLTVQEVIAMVSVGKDIWT